MPVIDKEFLTDETTTEISLVAVTNGPGFSTIERKYILRKEAEGYIFREKDNERFGFGGHHPTKSDAIIDVMCNLNAWSRIYLDEHMFCSNGQ